ncbi:MAG: ERCC4 domain-containing protein [Smithellaceae bacterium]|jgi:ERCC4-type nuclease|nr:ERCC4 domain-containing protein [Smithellaceae bacterium]
MRKSLTNIVGTEEEDDDAHTQESFVREPQPASPPAGRLIVKRNGHSITRQIPKPVVLIDTREKYPFDFSRFSNWIAASKKQALKAGDYSVEGMESLLILERKTLTDLITTVIQERTRFFKQCEKMSRYRWKALLIEASYEDIKTQYDEDEYNTLAHPNAVSGTLDALEARYGIPVIYTSCYRPLAEEKAASWLSKHFTYWYLEENGFGRVLQEGDL